MKSASQQPEDLKTQLKINKIHENKTIFPTEINHHKQPINMAIFNPSGLLFATCSNDGFVCVYNGVDYSLVNTFQIDSKCSAVKFIVFSQKGDHLFGTTIDKVFYLDVYRFPEEQIIKMAQRPDFRILDFKVSYGDSSLVLVSKFMFGLEDLKEGQTMNDVQVYSAKSFFRAIEPLQQKEAEWLEFEREKARIAPQGVDGELVRALRVDHVVELPHHDYNLVAGEAEFVKVAVYIDDSLVYTGQKKSTISKFNLKKSQTVPEKSIALKSNMINQMDFSDRFEFLIVSCNDSVSLIDPVSLDIVHTFNTKFPVLSARVTPLIYSSVPKYHLIYAGGIAAIDQARTSEGGNEIMIYNFAKGETLTKLSGCFGNVNFLDMFRDGSGFITAGQEGVARVYRFDMSYYRDKEFE
jgi:WD40 repeat protein